jgi:broad specificity phosphatase PhoE
MQKTLSNPTIFFVRHPEIVDNKENILPGWQDQKLDPKGLKQGEEEAKKLKGQPIAHIYTSPLQRATQNATILARATGAAITTTHGLLPWNYGEIAGKPNDKENQAKLQQFQDNPDRPTPGGESFNDYTEGRFYPTVAKMRAYVEANPDKALIASTHSRNLLALKHALGDKAKPIPVDKDEFPNASIWKVEFNKSFPNGFKIAEV